MPTPTQAPQTLGTAFHALCLVNDISAFDSPTSEAACDLLADVAHQLRTKRASDPAAVATAHLLDKLAFLVRAVDTDMEGML